VSGVASHAWNWIIQRSSYGVDSSPVGDVVEELDAPPPDPRVRIVDSFGEGIDGGIGELHSTQLGRRHAADKSADCVDTLILADEQLHEFPFAHGLMLRDVVAREGRVSARRCTQRGAALRSSGLTWCW
jgi:hypothetical protein